MNLWYNAFIRCIFSLHLFVLSGPLSLCSSSTEYITVPLHDAYKEEVKTKIKIPFPSSPNINLHKLLER
jgi:hypothetical protein